MIEESAILEYNTHLTNPSSKTLICFLSSKQNFKNVVFRGFTDTFKYLENIVEYNIPTNDLGNTIVTKEKSVIIEGTVAGETDKRKVYIEEDMIILGEDNIDHEWVKKHLTCKP